MGGDNAELFFYDELDISIHTTRVGGDQDRDNILLDDNDFNPHHPCGWWHTN